MLDLTALVRRYRRPLGLMQEGLAERSARLSADTIAKGEQGPNRPLPAAARRPDHCARAGRSAARYSMPRVPEWPWCHLIRASSRRRRLAAAGATYAWWR